MNIRNLLNRKPKPLIIEVENGASATSFYNSLNISQLKGGVIIRNKNTGLEEAYNQDSPEIKKAISSITGTDYKVITATNWRNAMQAATQPFQYLPSWVELIDIYENVKIDSHVNAAIKTLKNRVRAKGFDLIDENGEKNEDATKIFESKWFYDFVGHVVDINLTGFGLIQLGDINNDTTKFEWIKLINQKHVRPDLNGIVKNEYDTKPVLEFDEEPLNSWSIYIFFDVLGELNNVIRWYIYKTEVSRFWAEFNETFAVPPIIAKTNLTDTKRKNNLIAFLKDFAANRFGVAHLEDEIEKFDIQNMTSAQIYENLIRLADEQMSKSLLGSTMVLDNGSSRSQSETHEGNTSLFVNSICQVISFIVNDDLIPKMRNLGFNIPENLQFAWDNTEKLTMKEKAEILSKLLPFYTVDEDQLSEKFGYDFELKEATVSNTPNNQDDGKDD